MAGLGSAIDLGHDKGPGSVAILERFADTRFTDAIVVIPGIIHKCQTVIDSRANDLDSFGIGKFWFADMRPAKTDHGHFFARAS